MTDQTDEERRAQLEALRSAIASGGNVLAVVAAMNEGILESSGLDLRTYHLVRAAALAASGAGTFAWDATLEIIGDDVTASELMGVLVAIAPIIGTARFTSAASAISS